MPKIRRSDMSHRKSVILLGKGEQAIRVAQWFRRSAVYELAYVVPVVPEPDWTDSLIGWCDANGVPYVASGDFHDLPDIGSESGHVDLTLSVFYSKILPSWFIDRSGRCLNLHNAPLPKYRGVAPINWALKNGETTHGVTIHEIVPRVDTGSIVSQVIFGIHPESDEVIDVYRRALAYGYTLFEQTMPILDRITPRRQDEALASYYDREDYQCLGDRRDFTREASRRELLPARQNPT